MNQPQDPEKMTVGDVLPKLPPLKELTSWGYRSSLLSTSTQQVSRVLREAEISRFQGTLGKISSKYPKLAVYLAGAAGVCFLLAIGKSAKISSARSEIERRKEQLSKETYELKGSEAVNFPWNKENLNEWLYRPVKITGRPMHNKAIMIPRYYCGYLGYDYIVPLVTKENEDGSEKEGILLNKGWIPHEYRHVGARWRIENALPQTFEAYVSLNSEIDEKGSFFKKGNSIAERRDTWNHLYLPDAAEFSGLKNKATVKTALLECVNHNSALDERLPKHFSVDLLGAEDYPYPKTKAGALQLRHMPWELRGEQNTYFSAAAILGGLAGVLKFLA